MNSYPPSFLSMLREAIPEAYETIRDALIYDAPRTSLRINPVRENARDLLPVALTARVAWEENGYYTEPGFRPGKDIAHFTGAYYMQEASAMASARVLDAQPGERILDLCAAPGGKSGQIAAALRGTGLLIANEPDATRARVLAANLERLGAANAVVTQTYPQTLRTRWPESFDRVLVDAPCSGEGMFRRDPRTITEWSPARVQGCQTRQREILDCAARLVASGGRLVYSTCTFNRLENEDNVDWFLATHQDFTPHDFALDGVGSSRDGCIRLLPGLVAGEGHFVAAFTRAGTRIPRQTPAIAPAPARFSLLADTLPGNWTAAFSRMRVFEQGDGLYAVPPETPDLSGIRAPRPGCALATIGKGFVKPAHALAMAMPAHGAHNVLEMDDATARVFLAGETIPCDAIGWTLATWNGLPLGLGKGANGRLQNHVPKGLRM